MFRRGARVVDRARLESECALTGTEGSNPSLSALIRLFMVIKSRNQAFFVLEECRRSSV